MASRTLPGLALNAFWTLGEDGWNAGMDENLLKLSILSQLTVLSRKTALPATPANGDRYIVPNSAPSNSKRICVRDNGSWSYYLPEEGWFAWVRDEDLLVVFNGTDWVAFSDYRVSTKTSNYTLVLMDSGAYVRMNSATPLNLTLPNDAAQDLPIGSKITVSQTGAGQVTLTPAAGVTIASSETLRLRKQYSVATVVKVAADFWEAAGDLEAAP